MNKKKISLEDITRLSKETGKNQYECRRALNQYPNYNDAKEFLSRQFGTRLTQIIK